MARARASELVTKASEPDGRRLAMLYNVTDVNSKEKALRGVIAQWLKILDK